MKQIPNIITTLRIIGSVALLYTKPFSTGFFLVYLLCGISDVLDGYIARKTESGSRLGAVLDSVADILFIGILLFKLIPGIDLQLWMLLWITGIALIRFLSLGIGCYRYHTAAFLHTYANKAIGLLIFFLPILYHFFGITLSVCLICIPASLAAAEDLFINITSKELNRDIISVFYKK